MKRLSWKYIAGFVDGEGCIDVQSSKVNEEWYIRPRLRIAQTIPGKHVLEILKTNFNGYVVEQKNTNPNWTQAYSWELTGYKQVCWFLRNLVNHLEIKQEQARLCLWMEQNLKGRHVSSLVRQCVRDNLSAMKRDSHRLSEMAQKEISLLL